MLWYFFFCFFFCILEEKELLVAAEGKEKLPGKGDMAKDFKGFAGVRVRTCSEKNNLDGQSLWLQANNNKAPEMTECSQQKRWIVAGSD